MSLAVHLLNDAGPRVNTLPVLVEGLLRVAVSDGDIQSRILIGGSFLHVLIALEAFRQDHRLVRRVKSLLVGIALDHHVASTFQLGVVDRQHARLLHDPLLRRTLPLAVDLELVSVFECVRRATDQSLLVFEWLFSLFDG